MKLTPICVNSNKSYQWFQSYKILPHKSWQIKLWSNNNDAALNLFNNNSTIELTKPSLLKFFITNNIPNKTDYIFQSGFHKGQALR